MSRGQIVTVTLATLVGIGNGFYVFQPYLREQQEDKQRRMDGVAESRDLLAVAPAKTQQQQQPEAAESGIVGEGLQDGASAPPAAAAAAAAAASKSVWASIRDYGSRTFEPGDKLRQRWAEESEKK